MKKLIVQLALGLALGCAGLGMFPSEAAATCESAPLVQNVAPAPVIVQPAETDFSDADFKSADQPELGARTGGDTVIIGSTVVVVVVLVVLLLILI
ncbi:MAG TPA: hypothetical protein VL860_14970 [Planctomycetota bacterium]|nr:hypothetical protein [Planctomycetota bacterium]